MSSETSSSPSGKRSRDPEDEVYIDNLHSHKRYLSEIMASSLNGLTVGESLSENLMESPARSEGTGYTRDEVSSQYSPMSEDSDDSRYYDTSLNASMAQHDSLFNLGSPVSPHRQQRPLVAFSSPPHTSSYSATCSQPRQRSSDSEGRFPSSPSDICHSADLRRAALLRSVQMRAQPSGPPPFESPYNIAQESMHNIEESEDRPCSYMKPLAEEREFHNSARVPGMLEECPSMGLLESEHRYKKCYGVSSRMKDAESSEGVFEGNSRSALGRNASNG